MLTLERQMVYHDVWEAPIMEIASRYGFPESALRRICMRLNIPMPAPGYWNRLRAGKPQRRLPLPDTSGPEHILVDDIGNEINQETGLCPEHPKSNELEPMQMDSQPEIPSAQSDSQLNELPGQTAMCSEISNEFTALIGKHHAFEVQPKNKITVAKTLRNPDPLVVLTDRALKQGVKDMRGMIGPGQTAKSLNVKVHSTSIHRALCILDALVKGLAARHFKITFEKNAYRGALIAVVHIHAEPIPFQLTERTIRSERPLTKEERIALAEGTSYIAGRYSYTPTGKLKLSVEDRSDLNIEDSKGRILEERLNEFILLLIKEAIRCKKHRQEQKQREAVYRRQWEEQYAWEQELKRFEAVEQMARDWRRAVDVRDFLDALEAMIISSAGGALDSNREIAQWIEWGRQMADRIDPVVQAQKKGGIEIKR